MLANFTTKESRDKLYQAFSNLEEFDPLGLATLCMTLQKECKEIGYTSLEVFERRYFDNNGTSYWEFTLKHENTILFQADIKTPHFWGRPTSTIRDFPYAVLFDIITAALAKLHFADFSTKILPMPIAEEILEYI